MTKEQIIHIFKSFEHDAHFGTYLCSIPDTEYDDVADEILRLFSVSCQRELFISMIDKMKESDWREADNGFADRVFDRLNGNK